ARGRGSLPPPEALDHQPVRVDVVDADRRAEIDDRLLPRMRDVVAVDRERDPLAGDGVWRASGRVDHLEDVRAADSERRRAIRHLRSTARAANRAGGYRSPRRAAGTAYDVLGTHGVRPVS